MSTFNYHNKVTYIILFQATIINPFKKHTYSSCNGVPLGGIG